jgi:hypothetical protein
MLDKPGHNLQFYTTFYIRNLTLNKLVFIPSRPFQPSLMFVSKAEDYPSEVPFSWATEMKALGVSRKH